MQANSSLEGPDRELQGAGTGLSDNAKQFIRLYAVEQVQELARKLLREGGSIEERGALVQDTYAEVTKLLGHLPTNRPDDMSFLSDLVQALFNLEPTYDNEYAADFLCSDIGGIKFENSPLGKDIDFAHNLFCTIQRIGMLANSPDGDSPKNCDANEEFLRKSPEELVGLLTKSERESFHKL